MSYRTVLSIGFWLGLTGVAWAGVSCPASVSGHPLRNSGGGELFDGPVADNAILAPDSSAGTPQRYVNTWRLRNGARVTLICHYAGLPAGLPFRLTSDIRTCRQDQSSFRCE